MLRRSIRRYSLKPRNVWHSLDAWTYGLNTESTYNWTSNEWSVPINLTATKLTKIDNQPISIGGGDPLLGGELDWRSGRLGRACNLDVPIPHGRVDSQETVGGIELQRILTRGGQRTSVDLLQLPQQHMSELGQRPLRST
jgi:hypothetical protein